MNVYTCKLNIPKSGSRICSNECIYGFLQLGCRDMVEKTWGMVSDSIFTRCAPCFSPVVGNQDNDRHRPLCTTLGNTYFTHVSSKCRVVTAKIFEIFPSLTSCMNTKITDMCTIHFRHFVHSCTTVGRCAHRVMSNKMISITPSSRQKSTGKSERTRKQVMSVPVHVNVPCSGRLRSSVGFSGARTDLLILDAQLADVQSLTLSYVFYRLSDTTQ